MTNIVEEAAFLKAGHINTTVAEIAAIDEARNDVRNILDIPPIPKSWEWHVNLAEKYQSLVKVIQDNPKWWGEWKDKIIVKDDAIYLPELRLNLRIHEQISWDNFTNSYEGIIHRQRYVPNEKMASLWELYKCYEFMNSAWIWNRENLYKFLGFNASTYISSDTEHYGNVWAIDFSDGSQKAVQKCHKYYICDTVKIDE